MAESSESNSGGSWWGGWLQVAKEKSMSAIEMIKKDLEEFSNTMQHDTGEAVAKTSESLRETLKTENTEAAKDKLKQGLASFLDGLTKLLVVEAEDKDVAAPKRNPTDPIFDRAKARLHAIQVDPSTYCNKPSGPVEKYEEWLKSFDMDSKKGEVSELLVSQVEVRGLYTRLVPSEITHANFWRRYFYKVHQLQIDEARKLALMKRAEQSEKKEDSINWDDEDSSADEEDIKRSTPPKIKEDPKRLPIVLVETNLSKKPCGETVNKANNGTTVTKDLIPSSETQSANTNVTNDTKPISDLHSVNENQPDPVAPVSNSNVETISDAETKSDTEIKSETDKQDISEKMTDNSDEKDNIKHENKDNVEQIDSKKETDSELSNDNDLQVDKTQNEATEKTNENDNNDRKSDKRDKTEKESDTSEEIRTKEKGDVVVVNPDRDSPSTESTKGSADDDWERDFDVELTEEDMKAADEIAKKLNISSTDYTKLSAELDDDWESWE